MESYELRARVREVVAEATGFREVVVSVPKHPEYGHYTTPLALRAGRTSGQKDAMETAARMAEEIRSHPSAGELIEKVEVAPPGFLNFWITSSATQRAFSSLAARGAEFWVSREGEGKRVIVEYSQPNIAKRMHVGHLRTTIIGDALARIYRALGYEVVRWNYLGDWGTQFGKLIAAYKRWGNEEAVRSNPIQSLLQLYIKFHDAARNDPKLEEEGRHEFKKLADGDSENVKLWRWFKEESLKEFKALYAKLGVEFDLYLGESKFDKDAALLVEELLEKGIAQHSEGSVIVPLDRFDLPPALLRKSDGATLYLSRDVASLRYRLATYHPEKILYVVANEQSLHFQQLFALARLLRLDGAELVHVKYGMMLGPDGKKFATREGKAIAADDLIQQIIEKSYAVVSEKRPDLPEERRREIAHAIGIGALKYNDLKEHRLSDIVFDWKQMLSFRGNSAPYLQYTYARFASITRKFGKGGRGGECAAHLSHSLELQLIRHLTEYPATLRDSAYTYLPHLLAGYLYALCEIGNKWYETVPIGNEQDDEVRAARLALLDITAHTLKKGLELLGINVPEEI
ncbi:arginine--tRNA ligase [Candidatus Parcubacteria bacterium]|nr:MAG: arginine--tRNA ligase [Candidatus Parcubacteria bacterium]